MGKTAKWGLALILLGVILNNASYLNDVVTQKHEGFIYVGPYAVGGIIVALIAIAVGAWLAARRPPPEP